MLKEFVLSLKGSRKTLLNSFNLVQRLNRYHPKKIDLSLGRIQRLLGNLGHPEKTLPPVIHVAGTNGKGSVIAFMRAIAEAAGLKVHAYTSPHLIRFNERIRIAGDLISNDSLLSVLNECEMANEGDPISFFEITTAMAFLGFSRTPADLVLLETGLGGRLDATNVLSKPAVTALTPISVDHVGFLGDQISGIAAEKAAIMREGITSIVATQPAEAEDMIATTAANVNARCQFQCLDWDFEAHEGFFSIQTRYRNSEIPLPKLQGAFQLQNAAQAITCLDAVAGYSFSYEDIQSGIQNVDWPGRLQHLNYGPLVEHLPREWELWVDGGHNAGAGMTLAIQASIWSDKPLYAIIGMIKTKDPAAFIMPLAPHLEGILAVSIKGEDASLSADALTTMLRENGLEIQPMLSVEEAITNLITKSNSPARILICGSLYLAGKVLLENC